MIKYSYNIPMPRKKDMENISPHVHGWKSQNGWKSNINELFGW
jgi:hypothetical protein